jgi:hypothetical protein
MQSSYPLRNARFAITLPAMLCAAGFLLAAPVQGQNLLRNSGFTNGLADWVVPAALQGWTPLEAGAYCASDVEDWSYNGTVLLQNLHYAGASGKQLTVTIDVRNDWAPAAPPLVLMAEYIATGGQRASIELLEIQPADITTEWSPVSGSASLPVMAERLVGFSIGRLNGASVQFDSIRLEGSGLTAGPLPELATVRPYVVLHGQTIVLQGANFGAAAGKVLLDGSDSGVSVDSWATDRIEISLTPACGSGRLVVETSQGVRSSEVRGIEVASPYLQVGMPRNKLQGLVGQTIHFEAYVQAVNGYTPSGPIVLSCPELPAGVSFNPANLSGSGGTAIALDVTGLGAGYHNLTLQAMDGSGVAYSAPFSVEVLVLDHIQLAYNDSDWNRVDVDTAISFTAQFMADAFVELFGPGGEALPWDLNPLVWATDDSRVLQLFFDDFGGVKLLPQENGDCNLTITGPGGFIRIYPVTVDVPDSPKVTNLWFSSNPIPNDGALNYAFSATAVPDVSSMGIIGMIYTDYSDINWGSIPLTREFSLIEGHDPGKFVFNAGARNGGARGMVLEVVNAPTRAQVSGMVRMLDEPKQFHVQGMLEVYDASSGAKLLDKELFSHSKEYVASYLPAGNFKLRFIPDPWVSDLAPVWHPSATTMADAAVVSLSAGDALEGIHFFLLPPAPPAPPPPAPVMKGGQFSVSVPTEAGAAYVIEVTDSLDSGTWEVLMEFTGDGNPQDVVDDLHAAGGKRFYRVRQL